jgi:hypothetical protein
MASENALPAGDARQRITATIGEIQDRMSPSRILADGLERVTASSGKLAVSAGNAARAHPLALGAAAVAVGLALFTRRRLSNARVNLGDDLGDYTDYDDGFGFAEKPEDEAAPVARPRRLAEAPVELTAGEDAGNPVVSILIGLVAGAALGAIFPSTDAERRVLGDAGSKLGDAARAAARRAADELGAATRR